MNKVNIEYAPMTWPDRRTSWLYLGLSRSTLKRKEATGELVGKKDRKGRMRFPWAALDDFAARNGIIPDKAIRAEMEQEQEEPETGLAPVAPQDHLRQDARPASDASTGNGDAGAQKLGVVRAYEYIRESDGCEYADIVRDGVPALCMAPEELEEHLRKYLAVGNRYPVSRFDYERLLKVPTRNPDELQSAVKALVQTARKLAEDLGKSRKQIEVLEDSVRQKDDQITGLENELDQISTDLESSNLGWRRAADNAQRANDILDQLHADVSEKREQIELLEDERNNALARAEQSDARACEEEKRRIDLEHQLTTTQAALAVSQDHVREAQTVVLAAHADVRAAQSDTRTAQAHARNAQIAADGAQQYAERALAAVMLSRSVTPGT